MIGYAKRLKSLPRFGSDGHDYGKRRTILVTYKDRYVLFIPGEQVPEPEDSAIKFTIAFGQVVLYPVEGEPGRQKVISTHRMYRGDWEEVSPQMFEHLGRKFPVDRIVTHRTILLDDLEEPQEPAPLPKAATAASNSHPTWVGQLRAPSTPGPSADGNNGAQEEVSDNLMVAKHLEAQTKQEWREAQAKERAAFVKHMRAAIHRAVTEATEKYIYPDED